jgi:hypothetical protein
MIKICRAIGNFLGEKLGIKAKGVPVEFKTGLQGNWHVVNRILCKFIIEHLLGNLSK